MTGGRNILPKIVGIDPGLSGAVAMWDGETMVTLPMPAVKSTGRGREISWPVLSQQWDTNFFWAEHVFLERVGVRPGEGISSAFKFGLVFGGLRGMIAAKMLPLTLVTPTKWKKYYSLTASKEAAVLKATDLFPANATEFRGPRGGLLDGVAEAALIAKYGYDNI
jgi:crossover junction endodeoxyribonuclease RuvC